MIFELVSNRDLFVSRITVTPPPQKKKKLSQGWGMGWRGWGVGRVIRLQVIEGLNTSGQIVFCAFQSFLVEVQTNAGYMRRMRNIQPGD